MPQDHQGFDEASRSHTGRPPFDIVAINGSERAIGNTTAVLHRVRELVTDRGAVLEIINLREKKVADCMACGDCNDRLQPCIQRDDVAEVVERLCRSDAIIYAAPVHGYGMSSLMQRFIERAGVGYLRFERPLTNKVAGVIVTGRRYGHVDVHGQLLHNVLLNRMLLVGSGFPAVVHGGAPGEAMADTEGLASVTRMVSRMIDLLTLLATHESLAGAGLPAPVDNERAVHDG
jgi:multimeric flavodoxin WrbA